MTHICLLGASGSIGTQTLDVIKKNPNDFILDGFSVGQKTRKISSILKNNPDAKAICIGDFRKVKYYQKKYPHIQFFSGNQGLLDLIKYSQSDMVVNALVGFAGLHPTIFALENNLDVALANKESLVVGGEVVNRLLKKTKGKIYPIDSEHSALWKCLKVDDQNVEKMYITASGGAFRKLSRDQLKDVTPEMALAHPTWLMGQKITIDCATMVNKCFEIIEAHYLYNYPIEKIGVTLHDESHVHSYLKYNDGTLRAEISKPDMRNPIKFALYKGNIPFQTYRLNSLDDLKNLHFHPFDINRYPAVKYAEIVINKKGSYGAILNASNEVAVHAFLNHQISFLEIEEIIDKCMNQIKVQEANNYDDLYQIDKKTRQFANDLIKNRSAY